MKLKLGEDLNISKNFLFIYGRVLLCPKLSVSISQVVKEWIAINEM